MADEPRMMDPKKYREMKREQFMNYQKSMPVPGAEADEMLERLVGPSLKQFQGIVWDEKKYPVDAPMKRMAASKEN